MMTSEDRFRAGRRATSRPGVAPGEWRVLALEVAGEWRVRLVAGRRGARGMAIFVESLMALFPAATSAGSPPPTS